MRFRRTVIGSSGLLAFVVATWAPPDHPAAVSVAAAATAAPTARPADRLRLTPLEREPKDGLKKPSDEELAALRSAIEKEPRDRAKRFQLVRALMNAHKLDLALAEAKRWREKDAYNLVVVRLLGDIHTELGNRAEARRAYSAVVELLPGDAEAQRALATVLKQGGDLEAAHQRLLAAAEKRTDDQRLAFELGDVAQRLGRTEDARNRFQGIIDAANTPPAVRYPAKQRLAQIHAADRRAALAAGDGAQAKRVGKLIDALDVKGGVENDIKIYLTWDTDNSDVDLWVKTPSAETVKYDRRTGSGGEALFDDVTSGYGPESFTAKKARPGRYEVLVNYFGTRRSAFPEARGEVVVVLHEGTAHERKHVLPYRLYQPKQTVTVAAIDVLK